MTRRSKSTPLVSLYEEFYLPAKVAAGKPTTLYQHRLELDRWGKFLGRPPTLEDLTDEAVGACIAWLLSSGRRKGTGGLSPASVNKFRDVVLALWRHLHLRRIVNHLPLIPDIVIPKRIPRAWTRQELNRLWEYLRRLPGDIAGVPANLWFMAFVSVLWDSGERLAPIYGAKWADLDLAGGFLLSRAESRKGGFADKLHKLHPETVGLLRQIVLPKREAIFPWPWSRSLLHVRWRELLGRAGLPTGREFGFHAIRKSVASHVKANGGNPQEALGHYDPRMTEEVYIDPRIAPRQQASDVLFRLHDQGDDHAA